MLSEHARVLIPVKASPEPSKTYGDTALTGLCASTSPQVSACASIGLLVSAYEAPNHADLDQLVSDAADLALTLSPAGRARLVREVARVVLHHVRQDDAPRSTFPTIEAELAGLEATHPFPGGWETWWLPAAGRQGSHHSQ